ncbi:MAG: hypothetical protein QNL07_01555 [Candidatus Planktophila sp.]|jgi:hypothetical protein|tara:strand:- start:4940 stop:5365 length:426 start_codon:yes stop_codon:yes gene_type:complete
MAALNSIAPSRASSRSSRVKLVEKSTGVLLKLVPSISTKAQETHRFFAIFVSILTGIGFLVLLAINILLAQDAFTLSELKTEAKIVADQREAINRQIEAVSSPSALARQAKELGMRPSESPVFLNLDETVKVANGLGSKRG